MTKDSLLAWLQSSLLQGWLAEHVLLIYYHPSTANPNEESLYVLVFPEVTDHLGQHFFFICMFADLKASVCLYIGEGGPHWVTITKFVYEEPLGSISRAVSKMSFQNATPILCCP